MKDARWKLSEMHAKVQYVLRDARTISARQSRMAVLHDVKQQKIQDEVRKQRISKNKKHDEYARSIRIDDRVVRWASSTRTEGCHIWARECESIYERVYSTKFTISHERHEMTHDKDTPQSPEGTTLEL